MPLYTCSNASATRFESDVGTGAPEPWWRASAMSRIVESGGSLPCFWWLRLARLRWNGLGLVAPAYMPT